MKKLIILTASAIFLLGCNQTKNNAEAHAADNSVQAADTISKRVKLSVRPEILKLAALPDSITAMMTNSTADTITTGLHYLIEKLEASEWKEVSPGDIAFNDIGWRLEPNTTESFGKNLYKEQVHYKAGRYRIVKYYLKSDYKHTRKRFYAYAEFNIEE